MRDKLEIAHVWPRKPYAGEASFLLFITLDPTDALLKIREPRDAKCRAERSRPRPLCNTWQVFECVNIAGDAASPGDQHGASLVRQRCL